MSDELLPYYNEELSHIRGMAAEFARQHPKIAARLRISGDTVEDRIPPFLRGKGVGWVTAEYGMLPGATHTRRTASNNDNFRHQNLLKFISIFSTK